MKDERQKVVLSNLVYNQTNKKIPHDFRKSSTPIVERSTIRFMATTERLTTSNNILVLQLANSTRSSMYASQCQKASEMVSIDFHRVNSLDWCQHLLDILYVDHHKWVAKIFISKLSFFNLHLIHRLHIFHSGVSNGYYGFCHRWLYSWNYHWFHYG